MKNYSRKPAPSKLVAQFDNQLMQLLMEDLKAFSVQRPAIRKASSQQQLIAA